MPPRALLQGRAPAQPGAPAQVVYEGRLDGWVGRSPLRGHFGYRHGDLAFETVLQVGSTLLGRHVLGASDLRGKEHASLRAGGGG
eukprot:2686611-Alexandrium_andersonii.AAC.1